MAKFKKKRIAFVFKGPLAEVVKKKTFRKDLQKTLKPFMKLAAEAAAGEIQQRAPKNFGILVNSITPRVSANGLEATIGSPLIYARVMNDGRGKNKKFPPRFEMWLWVRRKLGLTDPQEIKRAIFLISRKIAKEGIEGKKFFEKGIEAKQGVINRILTQGFDRFFKSLGGK